MKDIFSKLRIPTILGLSIIFVGIVSGVFLTLREQGFISKASPDITPQNLTLTNISDTEVSISWQTSQKVPSFVTFGQNSPSEVTVLDERDTKTPTPYQIHYFNLKNLTPRTTYQYKITSSGIPSQIFSFTTAAPPNSQTGFRPINGVILDKDVPLDEAIAYLSIDDAITQSALVKSSGNFLIPLSQIRKSDLSDNFPLADVTFAKLTIISPKGQASAIFRLKSAQEILPLLRLGEDVDLTDVSPSDSRTLSLEDLNTYDLNDDGKINSADNSIVLGNQGINPKNKRADLNSDGIVDQRDLNLMLQKIEQLGSQ